MKKERNNECGYFTKKFDFLWQLGIYMICDLDFTQELNYTVANCGWINRENRFVLFGTTKAHLSQLVMKYWPGATCVFLTDQPWNVSQHVMGAGKSHELFLQSFVAKGHVPPLASQVCHGLNDRDVIR